MRKSFGLHIVISSSFMPSFSLNRPRGDGGLGISENEMWTVESVTRFWKPSMWIVGTWRFRGMILGMSTLTFWR